MSDRRQFRYVQIAEHATHAFVGAYKPGDVLPSENQMMESYGVARQTVREARRLMVESGLFYVRQGAGMFLVDTEEPVAKDTARAVLAAVALHELRCEGEWTDTDTPHRERDIEHAWEILQRGKLG